jgi:arylsulfatase A-like enzyme
VPFIVADRPSAGSVRGGVVDQVVELRDVMPTLLDLAGVPIPSSVDGVSLAPFLRGESVPVREWLHGEHLHFGQSIQWVTDGKTKYVWGSERGVEQLFDLVDDPGELRNLVKTQPELRDLWRERLIQDLTGREEGFVADGKLVTGRPVTAILQHTRERLAHAIV